MCNTVNSFPVPVTLFAGVRKGVGVNESKFNQFNY